MDFFQKSKRPQTQLLMIFNSIRNIMAGYTFFTKKEYVEWLGIVLLGVSSQTIVIFDFNMLLFNGKSFFRSWKDIRLIYLWASVALEMWLVMCLYHQNWICGVTGDGFLLFPAKVLLYSLLIWYWWMEFIF